MKSWRLALLGTCLSCTAWGAEGMWTFDQVALDQIQAKLGLRLNQQWLDHVRLSAPGIGASCSTSFVSSRGLVMTNQHCVRECVAQISTTQQNYIERGFFARQPSNERHCADIELNQLVSVTDVTEEVSAATKGQTGEAYKKALTAITATIEARCSARDDVRCDVVTLFQGGAYHLYQYKRFQDVRLVFAPEASAAHFGGDPDNFMFPRYSFDVAFLRVYEKGNPLDTSNNYLRWSESGAKEGSATFVAGHPGSTGRSMSVARVEFDRDVYLPRSLMYYSEFRGYLTAFSNQSAEHKRIAISKLYEVENSLKEGKHEHRLLLDPQFVRSREKEEADFKARIGHEANSNAEVVSAWKEIDNALQRYRALYDRYVMLERSRGFQSTLFKFARTLVRAGHEIPKANSERLPDFRDSNLPVVRQELANSSPIHNELEIATLTFSLTKLREELGPDDPVVKRVLDKKSPEALAKFLVTGSKLNDVNTRTSLLEGGAAAIAASTDPMIALVRDVVDAPSREIQRQYKGDVEAVLDKNSELIARARFKSNGPNRYPDGTSTLRLSFGIVAGVQEGADAVSPFASIAGAFTRHTGEPPFRLPDSWLAARSKLQLDLPLNLITTNDIFGGNSGSPLINERAEIVGLVHDSNLASLGAYYGYNEQTYRAIAVHSSAIMEILIKVYGADRIVDELREGRNRRAR